MSVGGGSAGGVPPCRAQASAEDEVHQAWRVGMNAAEIREKSDAELKDLLAQTREDLFRLRMQLHTGQL